jgi:hypothetical protein
MKIYISMTVLPTIFGLFLVLGVLTIYNFIIGNELVIRSSDTKFFVYFIPITVICALIIQYFLTLRLWQIFKSKEKYLGMSLFLFTSLTTIVCGLIFGFVFWETNSGLNDLLMTILTGVVAFAIYWTSNLITLKRLDKI